MIAYKKIIFIFGLLFIFQWSHAFAGIQDLNESFAESSENSLYTSSCCEAIEKYLVLEEQCSEKPTQVCQDQIYTTQGLMRLECGNRITQKELIAGSEICLEEETSLSASL